MNGLLEPGQARVEASGLHGATAQPAVLPKRGDSSQERRSYRRRPVICRSMAGDPEGRTRSARYGGSVAVSFDGARSPTRRGTIGRAPSTPLSVGPARPGCPSGDHQTVLPRRRGLRRWLPRGCRWSSDASWPWPRLRWSVRSATPGEPFGDRHRDLDAILDRAYAAVVERLGPWAVHRRATGAG